MIYTSLYGGPTNVSIGLEKYANGNNCLQLWCEDGPYATLTTNLTDKLGWDEVYIDVNNNPNVGQFIETYGFASFTGRYGHSGFCVYPIYKLDMEVLQRYIDDPDYELPEPEFTDEQLARIDEVYQKTAEYLSFMTKCEGWDHAETMEVADEVAEMLTAYGYEVKFPTKMGHKIYDIYPED